MISTIMHLIGQLGRGGAERQLIHLAGQLQRRGWPQAVVSFGGGDAWNHQLAELGIPLYEIPRHPFKPWRLWQLSRVIGKERPGLLHSWSPHVAGYVRSAWGKAAARTLFGVRFDLTVDANTGERIDRVPYLGALEHSDYAVSNSQSALDALQQRGVKLPPSEVIWNIVVAQGRARPAAPAACPRIVAVGSLIRRKGYDCLLRACGLLASEGRAFETLLIGGGPERQRLEELSRELGIADRVRFAGSIDGVGELLAGAHLAVHPSKREGLSNTILEAMAEGLPVIATRESASEIIDDGRTGLLVPTGEPEALAGAMRRLLDAPALRGELGAAALRHVRQCCDADVITKQYERVYHLLLEPR